MKKIMFECQYFKIRVRDIIVSLGIIILLITIFVVNLNLEGEDNKKDDPKIEEVTEEDLTKEEKEERMKEKLNDVCGFTKANINDFNFLLNGVDLCNADWFYNLDLFIKRIEEQNDILKDMTDRNSIDVYKHQTVWLKEIIRLI